MKKILITCIPTDRSGVPVYSKHLIDTFHKTSDIHLLTTGEAGIFSEDVKQGRIKLHVIPELRNTFSPVRIFVIAFKYLNLIEKNKFDLVHTQGALFGVLGRIIKTKNMHVLHTYHGLPFDDGVSAIKRFIFKFIEYLLLKVDGVEYIVISERNKDSITRLNRKASARLIPNFSRYSPKIIGFEKKTDLLSVAGFRPQKNHRLLFEIFNNLPVGTTLTCVGPNMNSSQALILADSLVSKSRRKYLRLLGSVDDVVPIYQSAKVYIQTSHYEGLSLAAIEARAFGLPLFLTETSGTQELLRDWYGGIVTSDVENVAQAIVAQLAINSLPDDHAECLPERFTLENFNNSMANYYG